MCGYLKLKHSACSFLEIFSSLKCLWPLHLTNIHPNTMMVAHNSTNNYIFLVSCFYVLAVSLPPVVSTRLPPPSCPVCLIMCRAHDITITCAVPLLGMFLSDTSLNKVIQSHFIIILNPLKKKINVPSRH